jgi:hypothetical protein
MIGLRIVGRSPIMRRGSLGERATAKKPTTARGTPEDSWELTPPLTSEFTMYRCVKDGKDVLVCTFGKTILLYDASCVHDLHKMLKKHGDWMELGSADEQKDTNDGAVEAWRRSSSNPIGGWYGPKKCLRVRFGMYVPPLIEALGFAEVEHNARGNRMRAI